MLLDNYLNTKGINNIFNGLYSTKYLKSLSLQNTGLVDQNCKLLIQIVNQLSQLKYLDISCIYHSNICVLLLIDNFVTYKGIENMENVIQINYSLNYFDIRNNQLDLDAILLLQEICHQYFTTLGECYIANDISKEDLILYGNEEKEINSEQIHQIIKDKSIFIISIYSL